MKDNTTFTQQDRFPFKNLNFFRFVIYLDNWWNQVGPTIEYVHFDEFCFSEGRQKSLPDVIVSKIAFKKCPNLSSRMQLLSTYLNAGTTLRPQKRM